MMEVFILPVLGVPVKNAYYYRAAIKVAKRKPLVHNLRVWAVSYFERMGNSYENLRIHTGIQHGSE